MYCTHCGKQNTDDMLFCGYCGKPLEMPEPTARQPVDDPQRAIYGRPAPVHSAAVQPVPVKTEEPKAETVSIFADESLTVGAEKPAFEQEKTSSMEEAKPSKGQRPVRTEDDIFADESAPIDIPDDDAPPVRPQKRSGPPVEVAVADEMPGDDDVPADLFAVEGEGEMCARSNLARPVQLQGTQPPKLNREGVQDVKKTIGPRGASTIVPRHDAEEDLDMEDIFLETDPLDDPLDDLEAQIEAELDGEFLFDEPESTSFFVRHVRGIVALILLAVTLVIVGYWLYFGSGQRIMGQLYLSKKPETYASLGAESMEAGKYDVAGAYFLKALDLDPVNEAYAIQAANAYIVGDNKGQAVEALARLIELDPDNIDSYLNLKNLFPDPINRPNTVSQLLQQGYLRTGNEQLKD